MSETDPSWRAICKRCTGRGFHYLTCPALRLRTSAQTAGTAAQEMLCPKCGRPVRVCRGCP